MNTGKRIAKYLLIACAAAAFGFVVFYTPGREASGAGPSPSPAISATPTPHCVELTATYTGPEISVDAAVDTSK
ncbi:MAG: hypothetical protein ILP07_09120, partial [Treponema sp.]|nr:hypothetical protein [Treponema sp.]